MPPSVDELRMVLGAAPLRGAVGSTGASAAGARGAPSPAAAEASTGREEGKQGIGLVEAALGLLGAAAGMVAAAPSAAAASKDKARLTSTGDANLTRTVTRADEDLPAALQAGVGHELGPWHGTIRHCDAKDLVACLKGVGGRAPHLALDCLAQIKLRCLRKQQKELLENGAKAAVRAAMQTHASAVAVQNLGREVLTRLAGTAAASRQSHDANEAQRAASSIYGRYAQRHEAQRDLQWGGTASRRDHGAPWGVVPGGARMLELEC